MKRTLQCEPSSYNTLSGMVAGAWYRATFFNAYFTFWYPRPLNRTEAREAAVRYAGPEYWEEDLCSVRRISEKQATV